MKISRVLFAVSLAQLAAAAPLAAAIAPLPPKPPAGGAADSDRDSWRGQAIGMCVAQMRDPERISPDELESVCGCGVDRLIAGRPTGTLPALGPDGLGTEIGRPLLACAAGQRPAVATAIARRLAELPTATATATDAKPVDTPVSAPDEEAPKPSGFNLQSWFDGLSLPTWLTDSGLPVWAWAPIALLAFALLRALFRRGDDRDLIGPPPSMRLGTRHNQPEPRRADPPQRS